MIPVANLAATRTSAAWKEPPGNWDAVNARKIYQGDPVHGIPLLPAARTVPGSLVAYNDRYGCDTAAAGSAVHAFLDDYRFEVMWSKPGRPLSRLARVGAALTPDFSLWPEMPAAMQVWQVYRSRWVGAWWLGHGIDVIPAVTWAGPETHAFAFAGIERGSVVAVSSVGVLRDRQALQLFAAGVDAMLQAVQPARILCYGAWPWNAIRSPDLADVVNEYPTRWEGRRGRPGR